MYHRKRLKSWFKRKRPEKKMEKITCEEIMNKENEWDHLTEASMKEGPSEKVTNVEMATVVNAMKPGKAAGPSVQR